MYEGIHVVTPSRNIPCKAIAAIIAITSGLNIPARSCFCVPLLFCFVYAGISGADLSQKRSIAAPPIAHSQNTHSQGKIANISGDNRYSKIVPTELPQDTRTDAVL